MPPQVILVQLDFMEAEWDLDTGRVTVKFPRVSYSFKRHPVGSQSKFEYTRELLQVMESEWYKYAFSKR